MYISNSVETIFKIKTIRTLAEMRHELIINSPALCTYAVLVHTCRDILKLAKQSSLPFGSFGSSVVLKFEQIERNSSPPPHTRARTQCN